MNKWDNRFLELAKHISNWSKDPTTKVGATIALGNNLVSLGYNGFPRNVVDDEERYLDRDLKNKIIVHAESNAILRGDRLELEAGTLYVWPFMPCAACAGLVIQAGIWRVVAPICMDPNQYARWHEQFSIAEMMFKEAEVQVDLVTWPN